MADQFTVRLVTDDGKVSIGKNLFSMGEVLKWIAVHDEDIKKYGVRGNIDSVMITNRVS